MLLISVSFFSPWINLSTLFIYVNVTKKFYTFTDPPPPSTLTYWPSNSKELATGLTTPPIIMTNDGAVSYFLHHLAINKTMNGLQLMIVVWKMLNCFTSVISKQHLLTLFRSTTMYLDTHNLKLLTITYVHMYISFRFQSYAIYTLLLHRTPLDTYFSHKESFEHQNHSSFSCSATVVYTFTFLPNTRILLATILLCRLHSASFIASYTCTYTGLFGFTNHA
ncbi:hypothetical protein HID58_032790 [Brassica napus]|uniref:Uncharacterized protein n=1 Tax=Brassica napus TaxID=3708 RepID=A0ABQ8BXF6_BRANA|nr:hypothetical protein HID58_032790 [Brassica napus]